MKTKKLKFLSKLACSICMAASAISALIYAEPTIDYMSAPFETKRVLDWGTRPDWSPDGNRIAFTENDMRNTFAYELDLKTNAVRCLTCQFGMSGHITRVYYLPDASFLLLAPVGSGSGGANAFAASSDAMGEQALYWLPGNLEGPMQPLNARAFGEIAISRNPAENGSVRIAWGEFNNGVSYLRSATLDLSGKRATFKDRKIHYDSSKNKIGSPVTLSESYGFTEDDQKITFYSILTVGDTLDGEMYTVDIKTGALSSLYDDPNHNETHLFPGGHYGLEESNRASDPSGKWRGVSSHPGGAFAAVLGDKLPSDFPEGNELFNYSPHGDLKGFNRPFDLFVVAIDGSKSPRQLTDFSKFGTNTHQSVPAPDGRRIAFAIDPRCSQELADKGGLYIGTFLEREVDEASK